jgi:hypothetical protein
VRTEREIRERIAELEGEMEKLREERERFGWAHVEAFVYGVKQAERDALRWALGEEIRRPKGEGAYSDRLPGG